MSTPIVGAAGRTVTEVSQTGEVAVGGVAYRALTVSAPIPAGAAVYVTGWRLDTQYGAVLFVRRPGDVGNDGTPGPSVSFPPPGTFSRLLNDRPEARLDRLETENRLLNDELRRLRWSQRILGTLAAVGLVVALTPIREYLPWMSSRTIQASKFVVVDEKGRIHGVFGLGNPAYTSFDHDNKGRELKIHPSDSLRLSRVGHKVNEEGTASEDIETVIKAGRQVSRLDDRVERLERLPMPVPFSDFYELEGRVRKLEKSNNRP